MPADQRIFDLAQEIWDYHQLNHALKPADAIVTLCSLDLRVADRAAELFKAGYGPVLVFSGNQGVLTAGTFAKPEAEVFADRAVALGVSLSPSPYCGHVVSLPTTL